MCKGCGDESNLIDKCITKLSEAVGGPEPEHWRDLTEHERKFDVIEFSKIMSFAEEEGQSVLRDISDRVVVDLLNQVKIFIDKYPNPDLSVIQVDQRLKSDLIFDLKTFINKAYLIGRDKIDSGKLDDPYWLNVWCTRKAKILFKKLETDLLFKIVDYIYDGETSPL